MNFMNKYSNKQSFQGLYEYLTASEAYSGLHSNFTTAVQIIENNNWEVKYVTCSITDDFNSIKKMYDNKESYGRMRIAREILKRIPSEHRNILLATFYECPGKFTHNLRNKSYYKFQGKYLDLSMLILFTSNTNSIALLEKQTNDSRLWQNNFLVARYFFEAAINVYENEYKKYMTAEEKTYRNKNAKFKTTNTK